MLSSYTFIVSEGTAERNLFKPNKRKIVVEGSNFYRVVGIPTRVHIQLRTPGGGGASISTSAHSERSPHSGPWNE